MSAARRTSRREFLWGKSAVSAFEEMLDAPPDETLPSPLETGGPSGVYLQFSRRAMACEFSVYCRADAGSRAADAAVRALDRVDQLEDQLTVYRDHSEVSQLNRRGAEKPVVVSRNLFDLLTLAAKLHQETGGAFDITTGPLTKVWGFYRRQGQVPSDEALRAALAVVGGQHARLDAASQTVHFARPGVEINLGAIGKGYALDEAANVLESAGLTDFLMHGGKSSVAARGSSAGATAKDEPASAAGAAGWTVGVRHPLRPEKRLAEIRLRNRAIGTSGGSSQSFFHQGRRYGHVLDPRTGQPAHGLLSATVLAPTAALADALSTACFVMGLEAALAFCESRAELSALFLRAGTKAGSVEAHTVGLAESDCVFLEDGS